MKFPRIKDVAEELRFINENVETADDENDGGCDVRLQVYPDESRGRDMKLKHIDIVFTYQDGDQEEVAPPTVRGARTGAERGAFDATSNLSGMREGVPPRGGRSGPLRTGLLSQLRCAA